MVEHGSLFQKVTITVNVHAPDPLTYTRLTVEVQKGVAISATSVCLYLYYWNIGTGLSTAAQGKTQREVL